MPPSKLDKNYWTAELIAHMPAESDVPGNSIDPNSCCWRIVFVVTAINYKNDTTNNYNYANQPPLDKQSVYPASGSTT